MDQDLYESPRGLARPRSSLASLASPATIAAALVFVVSIVVGVVATHTLVEQAVAHMPREEAYEALPRDVRAMELTLFGWVITFFGSLTLTSVAVVAVAYFGRTSPLRDSPSDR